MPVDLRTRVRDVRQDTRRSQKHIVLDRDTRIDRHVVLDLDVVPDRRPAIDIDVLPDDATFADPRIPHDVREMPDLRVHPHLGASIDICRLVDEVRELSLFVFYGDSAAQQRTLTCV